MKICPIAMAVGCAKCPVFKVCPLTSVIGDQPARGEKATARSASSAASAPPARPGAAKKSSRGAKSAASRRKSR